MRERATLRGTLCVGTTCVGSAVGSGNGVTVGKTASVLEAAARYCQSEPGLDLCRIPVLLNAASWRSGIPIDEWVVDNLHGLYGTPKKVSRALIAAPRCVYITPFGRPVVPEV